MSAFTSNCVVAVGRVLASQCLGGPLEDFRIGQRVAARTIKSAEVVYEARIQQKLVDPAAVPQLDQQAVTVLNLSQNRHERHTARVDVAGRRWKLEVEDLRDVDALLAAEGISPWQRVNVSRSCTILSGPEMAGRWEPLSKIAYLDDPERIFSLLDAPGAGEPVLKTPLKPGIVSDRLLTRRRNAPPDEVQDASEHSITITCPRPGGILTVHAAPELGYRYREVTWHSADGTLVNRTVASDYRLVGRIPYPFHHGTFVWSFDGELTLPEVIEVQSARFDVEFDAADFKLTLPEGWQVWDMKRQRQARAASDMEVDAEGLPALAQRVADDRHMRREEANATVPPAVPPGNNDGQLAKNGAAAPTRQETVVQTEHTAVVIADPGGGEAPPAPELDADLPAVAPPADPPLPAGTIQTSNAPSGPRTSGLPTYAVGIALAFCAVLLGALLLRRHATTRGAEAVE